MLPGAEDEQLCPTLAEPFATIVTANQAEEK